VSEAGTVANTRRAYWRNNPALQRHVSEAEFVARGYDRDLQDALAARLGRGALPRLALPERLRAFAREPGEDPREEEAA
jgi:hypothetical protein